MSTSVAKTPILLVGATGYIGGSVLARLIAHKSASTFDITILVRDPVKAKKFETFGVKSVVGSFDDLDKISSLAEQSHIVFQCADAADNEPVAKAILDGLHKRHATIGDLPILIHTSGTGVLTDDARGMYSSDKIYSDLDLELLDTIPPHAFHRAVDLMHIQADKEGYVRTYIITPSTVYGFATGPLVEAGLQNPRSIQIPVLVKAALGRKQAGMVGLGKSIWPHVHIDDTADLYIVLFDGIVSHPDELGHGRSGIYFAENGEYQNYLLSKKIGEALVDLGISHSAEPTSFTTEELIKYWGSEYAGNYAGTNSRCRGERSRSIGWNPKKTTEDFYASIKPEVEAIAKVQA